MPDELRLPELARSLRALGAVHGAAAESAHAVVFVPLLDARRIAETGGLTSAVAAFRGQSLGARIVARAADAARAGIVDPARARARAARAREALEPLRVALGLLDAAAPAADRAASAPDAQAWLAQLTRVFRYADDACTALTRVLAEPVEAEPRGWMGRLGR
jgi:hypothetical protein